MLGDGDYSGSPGGQQEEEEEEDLAAAPGPDPHPRSARKAPAGPASRPPGSGPEGYPPASEGLRDQPAPVLLGRVEQLEGEVRRLGDSLAQEQRTREELEDMLMRLERHVKVEEEQRRQAEDMVLQLQTKHEVEEGRRGHAEEQQREAEAELQVAKVEIKRLQAMLANYELNVREKMEGQFQAQLVRLQQEAEAKQQALQAEIRQLRQASSGGCDLPGHAVLCRVLSGAFARQELESTSDSMGREVQQWRQQAEKTAKTLQDARSEVLLRRRELDATTQQLSRVMDVLSVGSESGMMLSNALSSHISKMQMEPAGRRQGMGYGGPGQQANIFVMQPGGYNGPDVDSAYGMHDGPAPPLGPSLPPIRRGACCLLSCGGFFFAAPTGT